MTEPKKTDALDPSTPVDASKETTPVHDEAVEKHAEPLPAEEAKAVVADAPSDAKSFKVDVERALARETQDGPGDEEPGPSDFQGFATDGVEEDGQ